MKKRSEELFKEGGIAGRRNLKTEGVVELSGKNNDGDTVREAGDQGMRDIKGESPHPRESERDLDDARQDRRDPEFLNAVLRDNPGEDDRHRSGRAGDLHLRSSEDRRHHGGDNGGVEAIFGVDTRGERESERQGERHHGGGGPSPEIAGNIDKIV